MELAVLAIIILLFGAMMAIVRFSLERHSHEAAEEEPYADAQSDVEEFRREDKA